MPQILAFSLHFSLFLVIVLAFAPLFSDADVSPSLKAQGDGVQPQELWCVAKNNAEDAALQAALDWACGAGGADCGLIQQGGPCYDPSSVQNTASYAFNDYFLKHGLSDDSCNFNNNAALTSLNPSHDRCKFPSSLTVSNGSFTGTASTSTVGLGPSEDISSCSEVAWGWKWFWPLIITHLLIIVSR
ncbi:PLASMODESMATA CALLOSE-BINDING PROTEIN 5-like [Prosopis cineraria]|uniref:PLASMODESMATA CALLOSE-BINDING PROTEIN 5-like n=1 Tax=Prosopis cineraria TaxID=364024 RepID=UPI00240FFDBD|nr:PLASMODESMATA CALLOSE-BINDING PROTEIN 5-like [Prosopis cineraria]